MGNFDKRCVTAGFRASLFLTALLLMLTPSAAITEHQRLQDTVRSATQHSNALNSDMAVIKNELHALRMENQQLRADIANLQANGGTQGSSAMSDPFSRGAQSARPELPPLRALGGLPPPITSQAPPPESMTGVQYDLNRTNGYRPSDRF